MRGLKLSDGKGVGCAVRLTMDMIKRIQNYYGFAIRQNKGDLEKMKTAIAAIMHHLICDNNESLEIQHRFGPQGSLSWCRFWKDKMSNATRTYDESSRLPIVFMNELEPIFKRLSADELWSRCLLGLTQNQNESLNSLSWSCIQKSKVLWKAPGF